MDTKIKQLLKRLETNKSIEELKRKLSTLCRLLVEPFNLEMCLVVFHESNPLLDRFVVSFPDSDYENDDEDEIFLIESELSFKRKLMNVVPIMYKKKKIGAILMLLQKESVIEENDIKALKDIACKCAEAIGKLVAFEGKQFLIEATREMVIYKKKIGNGFEKNKDILFDLSMRIIVPNRLYIASQIEDGSYIYCHILAADGIIEDRRIGTFKGDCFEFMINEVRRDEPGITEIDIKDQGKVKGKLMVAYERSGSVYDEEIEKILLVLAPYLASLVELNIDEEETNGISK